MSLLKKTLLSFSLVFVCFFLSVESASAAVITWVGGTSSSWNADANWSGGVEPGASDIATFDGNCTSYCNVTIDKTISVAGINMQATYTGTITQSSTYTITVGASGWSQADGTFTGGSGNITLNFFTLSGGVFTSTTGTLQTGNFTYSGATFNHNNGTVAFWDSYYGNMTFSGSVTLYNVNYSSNNGTWNLNNSTITVLGTLTFLYQYGGVTISTGIIVAKGDVVINTVGITGTATLLIDGTGAQALSATEIQGSSFTNPVTINKPSGTLMLSGNIRFRGNFTYTAGTIDPGTSTVTFASTYYGTLVVSGSLTLYNVRYAPDHGTINLSSGTTTVLGTLTFVPSSTGTINDGTIKVKGDITQSSSNMSGTALLLIDGTGAQTYSVTGAYYLYLSTTINKLSGTFTLLTAATWNGSGKTLSVTSGIFDMNGNDLTLGTGGLTIDSGGTLKNASSTGILSLASDVTNNGSIIMKGNNTCGGSDAVTVKSINTTARAFSGTGIYTFLDATLQYITVSPGTTVYSSTLLNTTTGFNNNDTCPSSGTYTSSVIDTVMNAGFITASYIATIPTGETFQLDVGAGDSSTIDGTWTWLTNVSNGGSISALSGRYAAYRITTSKAFITSVTISNEYFTNQYLISSAFDSMSYGNTIGDIAWHEDATLPAGTYIGISLRAAADATALSSAEWSAPMSATTTGCSKSGTLVTCLGDTSPIIGGYRSGVGNQWFQYRIILSTSDGLYTPTLSDIIIKYVVNAPPELQNVTAAQQSDGTVSISYDVRDRDTNTGTPVNQGHITPSFEYSSDGGSHWSPIFSSLAEGATTTKAVSTALDGNGDSLQWTTYTTTWTPKNSLDGLFSATTQIRVTANDGEGANNTVSLASLNFTLDVKDPALGAYPITVVATPEPLAFANITLSVTDDSALYMKVGTNSYLSDAPNWVAYSSPTTLHVTAMPATVYAQFQDANGNVSSIVSVSTPQTPQQMVYRDLSNPETGDYRLFVSWDPVPSSGNGFAYYRVYRSTTGETASYTLLTSISNRTLNYIVDGAAGAYLDPNLTYYYKIAAEDVDGNISYYSTVVSHQPSGQGGTDVTAPTIDPPSVEEGTQTAIVSWTTDETASSLVTYCLTSCATNPNLTETLSSYSQAHEVVLSGLAPGSTYEYFVTSVDLSSNSASSDHSTFTTLAGPSISGVAINSVTNTTANITWTTNNPGTSFVHYTAGTFPTVANEIKKEVNENVTSHDVTLTGLSERQIYYFYVQTLDGNSNLGEDRRVVDGVKEYYTFTTTNDSVAPLISNVGTTTVYDTAALISWDTNEPANSFMEWGTESGVYSSSTSKASFDISHALVMSGLTAGTRYYYHVTATDSNANTSDSGEFNFITSEKQYGQTEVTALTTAANAAGQASASSGGGGGGGGTRIIGVAQDLYDKAVKELADKNKQLTDTLSELDDIKNNILGVNAGENVDPKTLLKIVTGKFLSLTKVYEQGASLNLSEGDIAPLANTLRDLAQAVPPPIVQGAPEIKASSNSVDIMWKTDKEANSVVAYAKTIEYDATKENPYTSQGGTFDVYTADHKVTLENLHPSTEYHFQIRSSSQGGTPLKTKDFTFTTGVLLPEITNAHVEQTTGGAVFSWHTNVLTNAAVHYTPMANGRPDEAKSATFGKPDYTLDHSVTLDQLKSGTTYQIQLLSTDPYGNTAKRDMSSFTTGADVVPPSISGVRTEVTTFPGTENKVQTIVFWTTDELSSSQVLYEEGAKLSDKPAGSTIKTIDMTTDHTVVLTTWKPNSLYSFRVVSEDASGNISTSKDFTVKTPQKKVSVVDLLMNNFSSTFGWTKNLGQ